MRAETASVIPHVVSAAIYKKVGVYVNNSGGE
jgi:hypothetical protein